MQVSVAIAICADPAILVFEQFEQDGIAGVFVLELAAHQIDESVLIPSGLECSFHMEYKASGLICLVLCAFRPSHEGI